MVALILGIVGIATGMVTLAGVMVRWMLVPYLENKMLERLNVLLAEVLSTKAEIVAAGRMFDGHIKRSQEMHDRLWDAIEERKR